MHSRATDTIAVLDELGIQKAHCLGGSVGAAICMILAKYYPERFKSYILATPYFMQFNDEIKQALLGGPESYLAKLEEKYGPFENKMIRKTFLANDTKALWAASSSEWFDYLDYAQYIQSPSLIYAGSQESSVDQLVKFSKRLANCQMKVLPDVGHAQAYWDSQLVAPLIREFVQNTA